MTSRQVTNLRLRHFNFTEANVARMGCLNRLRQLELSHVSFETRTLISQLSTLQARHLLAVNSLALDNCNVTSGGYPVLGCRIYLSSPIACMVAL